MLFGAASVALFYLVIRPWLGPRVALLCAATLAISPFHVWYSQDARPYAFFLFLSLLSLVLLQRLVARPQSRWLLASFVVSAAATFYCHTLGLPFLAFLATYALVMTPRAIWWRWALVFGAVGVLLVPAIYRLIVFAPTASADASRSLGLVFVPYALWAFATGYSIGPTLTALHLPSRAATALHFAPVILPIALLIAILALLGVMSLWKHSPSLFRIVALWFLFPLGFALAGTLVTRHPFNVRYIVLALPPFLIVIVMGLVAIRVRGWRIAAMAALAVVSGYSLWNYFFDPRYYREDNRAAGVYLAGNAVAGDLVIADAPYTTPNVDYYARRRDITIVGFPAASADSGQNAGVLRVNAAAGARPPAIADTSNLNGIIGPRDRFWLFLSRAYHGAPAIDVLRFGDGHFRRVRQLMTPNDILLILYRREGATR